MLAVLSFEKSNSEYITGITTSVKMVATNIPPMTVIAIGVRISEPSPKPSAIGIRPKIFLINEMSFSEDLIKIFLDQGIETVIFEWNNFKKYQVNLPNLMTNQPIILEDNNSNKINVIWANSMYFQKFQRCVYEQISEKDYLEFIKNESNYTSFIPIYSSDAEIFNFRPGRFKEEAKYF